MDREKLWKLFKLPSPYDLGMTDDKFGNALPMRDFQNAGDTSPTWEDWEELVKKKFPVRYFLSETLPAFFRRKILRSFGDFWYWLTCHLLPQRRYHFLDLRQPKDEPSAYRYGWLDSDNKIKYALFNILNNFVDEEMRFWYCPSEEEIEKDPHLRLQRDKYLEVKAIHYWWNIERKRQEKMCDTLSDKWYEAKEKRDPSEHTLWAELNAHDATIKNKTDEMMVRLIKVRQAMWT